MSIPVRPLASATLCWLGLLGAAPLAAAAPATPATSAAPAATVTIDSGGLTGRVLPSGVTAYLGVPFAQPPVGALRWRAPQPPAAWQGRRDAGHFAARCMQAERPMGGDQGESSPGMSEDCLYLNVWAPADAATKKHPVIFYIYGGGFVQGSSAQPRVYGAALARKGVVFVSVNYRVGVLGFLAHAELSAESDKHVSGNYGLLDQLAGLQWVRRNIAAFGGDPANVTIIGHSAGSMSVGYLQASPLAHGLIAKTVGLSGSPFYKGTLGVDTSLPAAEADGAHVLTRLNARSIAELRAVPAARIVATPHDDASHNPVIDGYVLPADAAAIFAAGRQNDVPTMVGFTVDEAFTPIGQARSLADYRARAARLFGAQAKTFLKLYPATTDAEAVRAATDAGRDQSIGAMAKGWVDGQTAHGRANAYVFRFARMPRYSPATVAARPALATPTVYHGADIPYWLDTLSAPSDQIWTDDDRRLETRMSDALVRFATSGDPAGPGLAWPAYRPANPQILEIGDTVHAAPWPGITRIGFFDAFSPPPR